MKYISVFAATAIAAIGWSDTALAQSSPTAVPAEFPPSSFTGRQYVDSTGCVFIRAGIDSNVTWVPRLTRGRQQVCGFQPSLSASAIAQVTAPRATATETTATGTTTAAVATTTTAPQTPQPAQTTTAAATTAPRVVTTAVPKPAASTRTPAPKTAPTPKPAAASAPATPKAKPAAAATAQASVPSTCSNRSAIAQQLLVSRRGDDVRCGPQTQPHVTIKNGPPSPDATYYTFKGHSTGRSTSSGQVRVAPKHVYEEQLASVDGISVPEGFEPVWEDDRLNPKRAHQTFAGKSQMDQIWTNRVPRTLKPGATGGSHVSYAAGGVPDDTAPGVSRAATVMPSPSLSEDTRRASHRYIQIGAFTNAENAQRAAQRLANIGLPTKMGPHRQSGKAYTLVIVGPYSTQGALDGGLDRVRGLGYQNATLKR